MSGTPTLQARIEAALTVLWPHEDWCRIYAKNGPPLRCHCGMGDRVRDAGDVIAPVLADAEREQGRLREALLSIANSSCCGCCREAANVARAALAAEARHDLR